MNIRQLTDKTITGFRTLLPQTRKNHALEHATINLLEKRFPTRNYAGYSIAKGFWILGHADIQDIQETVDLALARLQHGESQLAIHVNCGTGLAVSGMLAALGALVTLHGTKNEKDRFARFSTLAFVSSLMIQSSKPLGLMVQEKITTDPSVSKLSILKIDTGEMRGIPYFFIQTRLKI